MSSHATVSPEKPGAPGRAVIALLVVIAVMAGLLVFFVTRGSETDPDEVARYLRERSGTVSDVATEVIGALMTYDAESVDGQRDTLDDLTTGEFATQYEELLGGGLDEVLADTAAQSEGEIVSGPDISFTSATKAVSLARVVQEVSSNRDPTGRTIFYVMRITFTETNDTWLAERLEILSQQST
jgi:hypothetical protein